MEQVCLQREITDLQQGYGVIDMPGTISSPFTDIIHAAAFDKIEML